VAEGLNFVEVHTEGVEQAEHEEHAKHGHHAETGWGKWVAIGEAVLLSVVTITVAWSGFAAAKWSTEGQQILSRSAMTAVQASRLDLDAQLLRDFDAAAFDAWFVAYVSEKPSKIAMAESRFRPEMRVAFDAWIATNPETNTSAPRTPMDMAEYDLKEEAEAKALALEAQALHEEGVEAGLTGDDYVRGTVVLAGVLFLMGIGRTFPMPGVRLGLIGVGVGLLAIALFSILQLPAVPA
jgi:hypothetical protein